MKLSKVFNDKEKREFVQTLIIVAGILSAFNHVSENATFLIMFLIGSFTYLIVLSAYNKMSVKELDKNKEILENISLVTSILVGFSFSALIFIYGITSGIDKGIPISNILIISWFVVLTILGSMLSWVLIK